MRWYSSARPPEKVRRRSEGFRRHSVIPSQVVGQSKSEITGPALNPAASRLYFSSQRGPFNDGQSLGVTYEVSGPFSQILR
jgi:hypothetical protein